MVSLENLRQVAGWGAPVAAPPSTSILVNERFDHKCRRGLVCKKCRLAHDSQRYCAPALLRGEHTDDASTAYRARGSENETAPLQTNSIACPAFGIQFKRIMDVVWRAIFLP